MNPFSGTSEMLRSFLRCRAVCCELILAIVTCMSQPANADLKHLYSFNDDTASDSVGNAHGTLLGGAFIDGDGVLQLSGAGADYVSLNGPAINITSYTDATFEAWFTVDQLIQWERVFDLGERVAPANDNSYVYYTPVGSNGAGFAAFGTNDNRTEVLHGSLQTGHLYHLAMVIDDDANGGSDLVSVYLDGTLRGSTAHARSLSNVSNAFAYLGESLVAADPNFNGSIDEFRIYDHAFDLAAVQSSFAAGPTAQSSMRLEVNTVTGSVELVGEAIDPVTFDYYKITSAGNALDPAGWLSLSDQNVDTSGAGVGHSWDEETLSDSSELVELFLRGASQVDSNERLALGHAFDTSVAGQGVDGDLQFQFARQGGQSLRTGEVVYITPDPMDGDYNGDLSVNAADYTVWRNTLGDDMNLTADGDGDGLVDFDDYIIWKWNYGNSAGAGGVASDGSSVPEPVGIVLAFIAFVASAFTMRRRR